MAAPRNSFEARCDLKRVMFVRTKRHTFQRSSYDHLLFRYTASHPRNALRSLALTALTSTCLDNVYNDKANESVSWAEVYEARKALTQEDKS